MKEDIRVYTKLLIREPQDKRCLKFLFHIHIVIPLVRQVLVQICACEINYYLKKVCFTQTSLQSLKKTLLACPQGFFYAFLAGYSIAKNKYKYLK